MEYSFLLSIIIPCYNSAGFIANTIDMLIGQGLSDCELILVNDGSKDDTLQILKRYEVSPNIRVIDQLNQGVSVARNTGLSVAKGRYVYFLDSDDSLTAGSLDYFKRSILQHPDCQFFAFGYETRCGGVTEKKYVYPRWDGKGMSGRILTQSFLTKKLCVHICSCIYERQFLQSHQFCFQPGVAIGEDILFLLQTMFRVEKGYYSARTSFVYQIREDSAMQGYKSYSLKQYYSHTLLREYLLPLAARDKGMRRPVNFFLLFSYLSNLRYYLRSDVRDEAINRKFIADGSIRYKRNFAGNLSLWLLMKLTMLFPLRLFLLLLKR